MWMLWCRTAAFALAFSISSDPPLTKMEFYVREGATERDLERLLELNYETFKRDVFRGTRLTDEELREKHRTLMSRYDLKNPNYIFFVAEDADGGFAGALWAGIQRRSAVESEVEGQRYAWIYDIEVDPGHRGRGLGRDLLARAEEWARGEGLESVELHVFAQNEAAVKMYRSAEYCEKSLIMRKNL